MKVTVIFDNLGPYHCARLNAAARLMQIYVIELHAESTEYAWDEVISDYNFERLTINRKGETVQSRGEIKSRLHTALKATCPDVVVIPGWSSAASCDALGWAVSVRIPVVIMSESNSWDEPRKWWKELLKRFFVRQTSAALVGGESSRNYIVQLGLLNTHVFVGYDVIDNDFFQNACNHSRSEDNPMPPYFLTSCRFVEKKNLFRLLDAYAAYCKRHDHQNTELSSWNLCLLGDGELRDKLITHCNALDLAISRHAPWEHTWTTKQRTNVFFPGFRQIEELPRFYAHAGVLLHPSTTEQWGLVINEAMACGLPVAVSNRCGCASDLVEDGGNGLTFAPHDTNRISDLMFDFSSRPSKQLADMGMRSRQIIAKWGPARFGEGLLAAVNQALVTGPKRPSVMGRIACKLIAFNYGKF